MAVVAVAQLTSMLVQPTKSLPEVVVEVVVVHPLVESVATVTVEMVVTVVA
jgi:hypothetical protein